MNEHRTKWIKPLFAAGTLLGVVGLFSLVNRFQGGFMSEGLLRHGSWMIISLSLASCVGCFAQALEWKRGIAEAD